jgi:DNA-binding MarR family transcriptional regulator
MRAEQTIDFPIRLAWHKISRLYNMEASKHGGSMSLGYILLNIDHEGTPSTRLGPRMGMEATSLARTLKSMEEKNLISRQTDQEDKRKVLIFLTSEGARMREIAKKTVIKFNDKLQSKIDVKKLETFFEVIYDINDILETEEIFTNDGK